MSNLNRHLPGSAVAACAPRSGFSVRSALRHPSGYSGAANALTGIRRRRRSCPTAAGEFPIMRGGSVDWTPISGPPRASSSSACGMRERAICTSAAPEVAKERAGSTRETESRRRVRQLRRLDRAVAGSVATGKADAGIGMAPLAQAAGAGVSTSRSRACMAAACACWPASRPASPRLEDLRGKTVAISDQASLRRILLDRARKEGLDPVKDVEWRQYPMDLLTRGGRARPTRWPMAIRAHGCGSRTASHRSRHQLVG